MSGVASAPMLTIEDRFCGPPGTGNGGYVAGRLAAFLPTAPAIEVTLRRPVPLGQPLHVMANDDGLALCAEDGTPFAAARATTLDLGAPPQVPDGRAAAAASRRFAGFRAHSFSRCFVCGPARGAGDGLRIFPGAVAAEGGAVAAPWTPDSSVADADGEVRPEFLWSALDCPGAFALMGGSADRPMLLGRITARLVGRSRAGEACIVVAWPLGAEGRKLYAGSAVYGEDGTLRGLARATWFEVPRAR